MASNLPNLKFKNVLHYNTDSESDNNISRSSSDDEGNTVNDVGLTLEKLNLGPKKKLLILSVGGLLVHRVHVRDKLPTNCRPDIVYGKFQVFKRPFCDEFMKFCFDRFEVGIWSSAMEHNVDNILETVMGGLRRKLLFVWDQEECTNSGFQSLERKGKPIFLKELKKVWENKSFLGKYLSSNTLLIDDEPYKALFNPPNTAIFPRKYKIENGEDTFLGPKGELQMYLDGLADADSVTCYVKEHPFGQPAITPSHSDYGYYSKIIRRFL